MRRAICGFHLDDEGHWVAELCCGHGQHVRHRPPWERRPWVLTEPGRATRLGVELECKRCGVFRAPRAGDREACAWLLRGEARAPWDAVSAAAFLDASRAVSWILEGDDASVWACGGTAKEADGPEACAWFWLCVDPARRRQGLGRALFEHWLAQRPPGGERVQVWARAADAGFYERLGFQAIERAREGAWMERGPRP